MAVLKDLIVHGQSRFINGINADNIHTNLIDANEGIFKTITTTTLDAGTVTTDMLTATNARVSQTLTVDGTISTNKWEAANIANIGGNFYISPTGKADSGTITITKTSTTTVNGVSVGVYTLVVGSASFGVTSTSSTIWGADSKVIFTGSISYNSSKKYPLGTCNGTMTTVSTGTNILTGFTITGVNSPALDIFFKEVGISSVSSIACSGYEMQISVYQSYYSSTLHPIGILLTSYGKEKKQYIDIYGGANTLGDSASGFANPSVRIGQLDGLPNIVTNGGEDTLPTGWGIYTDNGFFKGKIVANAGRIGSGTAAWTIGNDGTKAIIYTGTRGSADSAYLSTGVGTESIGGSGTLNTTNDGYWAFTAGANFGVTTKGKLFANSASITGSIVATSFIANYNGGNPTASLDATGLTLYDANGGKKASFGSTIYLYGGNNTYPLTEIGSNGISIKSSSENYGLFNTDGLTLYLNNQVNAEFKSYINLGSSNTNTYTNNGNTYHYSKTITIGTGLTAIKEGQMVVGNYNTSNSNALFIIGNGTSTNLKNAFTVESIYNTVQKENFDGGSSTYTLSHTSDSNINNTTAYDLYGTQLTATGSGTTITITSGTITSGDRIEINYSYLDSNNESVTTQEFYLADTDSQTSFTVANTISSLTSVYNKSVPVSLAISSVSESTVTLSASSTTEHQIQINYICIEDDSYVKISNSDNILGAYSLAQGDGIATGDAAHAFGICVTDSTMVASSVGSSVQGYANNNSTMTASGIGSSIYGSVDNSSTMTASKFGSSVQGYANNNSTMTASKFGSSIYGSVDNSSTMTASSAGSSVQGYAHNNSTMTASDYGSSIQGYANKNSTMTASDSGSSIQGGFVTNSIITASGMGSSVYGYAYNSTITAYGVGSSIQGYVYKSTTKASGNGSSIQGYAVSSTMTASGIGSSIQGYANYNSTITASDSGSSIQGGFVTNSIITASGMGSSIQGYANNNSTMTASGDGSSVQGYANNNSTMTASGNGSSIYGYAVSSTMTASGIGSIALNESTHALSRAQLAIGTFNSNDSTSSTTHPSRTTAYGQHAFIIGNGTAESSRSNALAVDWNGDLRIAGDIYTGCGADSSGGTLVTGGSGTNTIGDGTMAVYAEQSNEFNFGGSYAGDTIFIGYRAKDSKPIPSRFVFGYSTGTASLIASSISLSGGASIGSELIVGGATTISGVTTVNNALYSNILYTGSAIVSADLSVGGTLRQSSDRKLKTHLNYLNEDNKSIAFIRNLKPAHYIKNNKPEVGFYAQDIQEIDTWKSMVADGENGLTLSYTEIIAPLVSYCQHLEKRIAELESIRR